MDKNIVIFGGSFDPMHCGHINLIKKMLSRLDNVVFYIIPSGIHPESKNYLFTVEERITMIKSCIGQLDDDFWNSILLEPVEPELKVDNILISDYEIEKTKVSYTIDTILFMKKKYKDDNLHLLIGADQYMKFSSWYRFEDIFELAKIWVYPRSGFIIEENDKCNIVESKMFDISSTDIRNLLLENKIFDNNLIPDSVKILADFYYKNKVN